MGRLTTALSWAFWLVPMYIFVIEPFLRTYFPSIGLLKGNSEENRHFAYDSLYAFDSDYEYDPNDPSTRKHEEKLLRALNITDEKGKMYSVGGDQEKCSTPDEFKIHILGHKPLVIYIENFVSAEEADYLVRESEDHYAPSIVYDGVSQRVDPSVRLSDRALLERDPVVRCIEERARAFQGWRPFLYIERMWAQRYNVSGHYSYHFDWRGGNTGIDDVADRASTFMVYLNADCSGGGTIFPRLRRPSGRQWCDFVYCEADEEEATGEKGLTFKPIKGNAIFWENLRPDGTGYPETWHAALPVRSGKKVGLNIWSWYQPPSWTRKH